MKYNKLVRDNIPAIIKAKGGTLKSRKATKAEYWQKLKEKLAEEVTEFQESENAEELADILEVIEAIEQFKKIDKKEVAAFKRKKRRERGGFAKRIILEES
jgi:predicted house-cleaning noncanonical NTP pyrophosphatase (MazG superfamily)